MAGKNVYNISGVSNTKCAVRKDNYDRWDGKEDGINWGCGCMLLFVIVFWWTIITLIERIF